MGAKFFYRNADLLYFVNNKLINNNLINQKDRMLLSFSGGQDSICFVFIVNQLYSQLELDITFFWCHHLWQIDSFYLMQQIAKLSFLLQFDSCFPIPLNCISSELLARKWRQRCSYRVSLFYNYSKICLAHTFNDKVENIFLNFIRGTGLLGLTPLRWTQFISKSSITSEKRISRHNYLNNSCCTNLTNPRFVVQSQFVPFVPVACFSNSMRITSQRRLEGAEKSYASMRNDEETPIKLGRNYEGTPKELRRGSVVQTQGLSELCQLSKSKICYVLTNSRGVVLYKSSICKRCVNCTNRRFVMWRTNGMNLTNINTNINPRFVRRFVQIGNFLPQKDMFCLATKTRTGVNIKVTNEYKAKPFKAFTFQPASDSSRINSCCTDYFREQRRRVSSICATSPKYGKQLLNCGKGCYRVRPLLSISRVELNKICYFWKLPIYPDKSNQKVKFSRNRVRGQLLPTIKLFFNLNIENIFLQLARIIETEDYCLTQIVNEFTKNTDV